MLGIKQTSVIILLIIACPVAIAQFEAQKNKAEKLIEPLLDIYPGLSVAVGVGNEIVWEKGFGYSNVESETTNSSENQFRFYSLSKSITGLALISLIQSGKLDIEKSIKFYLSDLPGQYEKVKVKHLINHTSGVRHYHKGEWLKISSNNCQNPKEALSIFIDDPLISSPGVEYNYSSFGYVLLSELIGVLSEMDYEEYVRKSLLEPFGIFNINTDQSKFIKNQVSYYAKWNKVRTKAKPARSIDNTCKFGGGSFVGTARDLVKLHLAVLNGEVLNAKQQERYYEEILTDEGLPTNYAFGLGNNITDSGVQYYAHTGSGLGASSALLIYPKNKVVVVLLGNIKNGALNKSIAEIAKLFKS